MNDRKKCDGKACGEKPRREDTRGKRDTVRDKARGKRAALRGSATAATCLVLAAAGSACADGSCAETAAK